METSLVVGVAPVLSFGISLLAVYFLSVTNGRLRIVDHPGSRSLHARPIPRTGGLGIWGAVAIGLTIGVIECGFVTELAWLTIAATAVGVVSFVDDVVGIAVSLRLCVHVLAALVLIVGGFVLEEISVAGFDFHLSATLGILISALFIVWMINLYNFMDGMDGFAGGMAVIGFGTLGVLGMRAGDIHFALFSWLIAASAAGFLIWNFPPARIFLGDTGASVLGLLAAGLGLWGNDSGIFPIWIALLVFSPFIMDATVTLLRRLLRREAVWKAHREHYYQRLVMRGWGHKKTVLLEFAVMIGAALTAIFSVGATPLQQICALIVWTAVYFFGFVTVDLLIAPRVASCHPCSSGFEDKG